MNATPRDRHADAKATRWLHHVQADGVCKYRMGRRGKSFVAEWPGLARLTCDKDGRNPRLTPCDGAHPRVLTKLRGVAKALLADLRGGLGVHASAVVVGSRAVLILGASGAGKSTAAAGLCLRHGGRLLADDAALLEEHDEVIQVAPSESRHYLTRESSDALGVPKRTESASAKASVRSERTASKPYPLALVVSLRFDETLERTVCRRMDGAAAAFRLLDGMFRFDLSDRRSELDRVMRIYETAPFLEISRPSAQPDVVAHIVRELGDIP